MVVERCGVGVHKGLYWSGDKVAGESVRRTDMAWVENTTSASLFEELDGGSRDVGAAPVCFEPSSRSYNRLEVVEFC